MNLITAAFSADGVRIPGVNEFLPVRRGLRMGETLTLGIRPEFVECVPAGTSGSLPAQVIAARNMGTHWLVDCQLGEHRIAAKQRALHPVHAGDAMLIDQGFLCALRDPEVVEMAARYGDPVDLLEGGVD